MAPKKPKEPGFVVMGMPSSGSTWVYNVMYELFNKKHKEFKHRKRHGYIDPTPYTHAVATYRDMRDSLTSMARKERMSTPMKEFTAILERHYSAGSYDMSQILKDERVWLIKYEDYFPKHQDVLLDELAKHCGVKMTAKLKDSILKDFSIDNIRFETIGRSWKKFTPYHITNEGEPGAWKEYFTPEMVEMTRPWLSEMLITWQYEEDESWEKLT